MKKQTVAIIIGLVSILILCIILLTSNNQHKYGAQITQNTQVTTESSSTTSSSEAVKENNKTYTEELREKAREDFLTACTSKLERAVCVCSADYLGSHYSDLEIAQMYLKYHSTKTVTKEMQTAYDACVK